MLNLFDRLVPSYTRPTYTLDKAGLGKQKQFRKTFESLKKGKQRIIPTYGKHKEVKLAGL